MDSIYGNFQYCYNSVPVIRGYCSFNTLIKHSRPHPAYQRESDKKHVDEIRQFLNGGSYRFMPEIVLSYDYSGMFDQGQEWAEGVYTTPFEYLLDPKQPGTLKVYDHRTAVEFRRVKSDNINNTFRLDIHDGNPLLKLQKVFNRIDGNHRLEALEGYPDDFQVPYCIVLLADNSVPELRIREKNEMEIFHNINSKVKPLTPIEQYRGLFRLFSVSELEKYGKPFSLTKAYLEKYYHVPCPNLHCFLSDQEDIILFCIWFLLDHGLEVTEDDIYTVLAELNHTYFAEHKEIQTCKNRFALIPYVFYCFKGEKKRNAKLTAYNTWFIKNRLYNMENLDPASMIDVFDSIYEIRQKQVFVAMPFMSELDFVYDAICDAVNEINNENDIDLPKPVRIDKQIVGFSYDIVSELLEQIKDAGLLIADLTAQNANVYYEAGFAQGLLRAGTGNTSQILYLISNPDDPDKPFETAKFDIEHYKMIAYKNAGNGASELKTNVKKELLAFYGV